MTPLWWVTRDADPEARALFDRHYSRRRYADGRTPAKFIGPGEYLALRTELADALFVWRKFIDDSGQRGISCAVFRNESAHPSSLLIQQADAIADRIWPDRRHYTFVNPSRVRSSNPGFCFQRAGWRKCGRTGRGLIVLERIA